jgi:cation:H+ antiporter
VEHAALFTLGLVLLAVSAPLLVFGAARLDRALGRSPFAVGIVAVAFGPCIAALTFDLSLICRQPPITRAVVGHLVGHNIASLGLVLGVAALVRPIAATAKLFHTAIPLSLGGTVLFWFLARESPLSRVGAGFLLVAFVVALVLLIRAAMRETEQVKAEFASWVPERMPLWMAGLLALAGVASLLGGAHFIAAHVVGTATHVKSPSFILADTLGAFITSLPTLVVAVIASHRGRPNIALGVAIAPAIVNLLLLAGVSAVIQPLLIDQRVILEVIPAMGLLTLVLMPTLMNGLRVPRWEGVLLLVAYAGFIAWQVWVARMVAQTASVPA